MDSVQYENKVPKGSTSFLPQALSLFFDRPRRSSDFMPGNGGSGRTCLDSSEAGLNPVGRRCRRFESDRKRPRGVTLILASGPTDCLHTKEQRGHRKTCCPATNNWATFGSHRRPSSNCLSPRGRFLTQFGHRILALCAMWRSFLLS